ncbi:MAG: hypothetical protein JWQ90_4036 [Hydrocarboniphaga sp.]|uniref:hypothetical protein n=1 Tax=Hydrocarboniphaga sp. TaxID=2033016 RepID=UPI0026396F27|nr:hypothetical protein [Hydrocarboniphaga sp.]MDB5971586.1 hypothetical protein [Hydrocarboniphaga sp.]
MDAQKILDFFEPYPTWFKVAAVVCLAFLVIGLLTLRQTKTAASSVGGAASAGATPVSTLDFPGGPALATESNQSLISFYQHRQALDGRFFELQEFGRQMSGKQVMWEGFVADVSDQGAKDFPILLVVVAEKDKVAQLAVVSLPEAMRARVYSLRKSDLVRFKGVISSASQDFPSVKAEAIEFLPTKRGG